MPRPYSPIINPAVPEQYILDLTKKWYLEFLAAAERDAGKPPRYFPPLKSYVTANDFEGYWPEDDVPALLVMWGGMADKPVRRGDGKWDVKWLYGCAIVVSTNTRADTRLAQAVHISAFTDMMLKHRSLEHPEHIADVDWVDGRPAPMPPDPQNTDRMLGAAQMFFSVGVKAVNDERGTSFGEPREDPYEEPAPLGVVQEGKATATIIKKGQEE